MNSCLYIGQVSHKRFAPVEHPFRYPVYIYALDLDELETLSETVRGFSYNHFNLVCLRDRDYLRGAGSIRERVQALLSEHGCSQKPARIMLVTMARFLNYAFNPVSFYYCYDEQDRLVYAIAEVNNTFHERHAYLMEQPDPGQHDDPAVFRRDKQFHVSPFNNMDGHYELSFGRLDEQMRIGVTLFREEQKILVASIWGSRRPLTSWSLLRTVLTCPLTAFLTFPRISWQAARLLWQRKLKVYHKPNPTSTMTIGIRKPTRRQRFCTRLVRKHFARFTDGSLIIEFPNGTPWTFGEVSEATPAVMRVVNFHLFERLVLAGSIGLGESYTAGEWMTEDLTAVLSFFARNLPQVHKTRMGHLGHRISAVRHALHRNTPRGSRRNIHAHYDLGNEFYRLFLDERTMMYSSAVYEQPDQALEQAQCAKIQRLVKMAGIEADHHVLEIGCGWGGFAIEAVRQTGCRVTGITISQEQYDLARERVEAAGLADRISIELCDYRDLKGQYDRIVSIEMLEAVGHEYFGTFFETCDRVLKHGGCMVLQVITIPDHRYDQYRYKTDWIQKYIFPGGLLPSLTVLSQAITRHSSFYIDELSNIGPHYAPTLAAWRRGVEAHRDKLPALGFDDEFLRKWRYYLCYCEAGFASGRINDLQLRLKR